MDKKHLLVTGGAGFIGSNFIPYFLDKYPFYHIINLDKLTYAGNLENLKCVENHPNYTFILGDICDKPLVEKIFNDYSVKGIIHFAAESHVDNSIHEPLQFVMTNVLGTASLLDAARISWMEAPFKYKKGYEDVAFLHVSTDEVYGSLGETGLFVESTPYTPNSPYSASKASSDMLVRSFFHTYGLRTITTNCSNNYGPNQHDEKLIPTIIRKALKELPIPIYGDGKNVRDWLYVLDHCRGIDTAFHSGLPGENYNIGGRNERNNIEIATIICDHLDHKKPRRSGKYRDLITFVSDRPGHDKRYAIDASKIENELGWKATETFETGIYQTIEWYLDKYKGE